MLLSVDASPIITFAGNHRNPKFADSRGPPIIADVLRRIHVSSISVGENLLDAAQARHARDVLRLEPGTSVEIFDDAGNVAGGELVLTGKKLAVRVAEMSGPDPRAGIAWRVAAAVPKGERADWMIEKLSELGTAEFIPLSAARSVVLPEGTHKRERWIRIATESAKQSRRRGVMRIGELTSMQSLLKAESAKVNTAGLYFSTAVDAVPVSTLLQTVSPGSSVLALIGPEGGWTEEEVESFAAAKFPAARLTETVLRVETAAIAAASVISCFANRLSP